MALIWIDESEVAKIKGFQALTHTEYNRIIEDKIVIKKFIELRLSAIKNSITNNSTQIKDEEVPLLLRGIRLIEQQLIPVLNKMQPVQEEKDLQPVEAEYTKDTTQ